MIGPGGAGVSTVAAAAAVAPPHSEAGGSGGRTLLVTLDRFRQAARVFGVYSTPGQPIPVSQRVDLLEIDTLALLGDVWALLRGPMALAGGSAAAGVSEIDPDELTGLPGIEQLLAWRRIRDEAVSGAWERVVVDCSGSIDAVGFLGVAELVAGYLEKIWPRHRRLAGASENPKLTGAAAVVDALVADCEDIIGLLVDPTCVHAHLVVPPGVHGREMTQRHLAVLALMGISTSTLIGNPGAGRPAADDAFDAELARDHPGLTTVVAQSLSSPPRTVAALRKVGVDFSDAPGPPAGSHAAEVVLLSGSGLSAVYRLRWRQPLPDPRTLALGRSGDDLLVTVSGFRHRVPLPSVLRRCSVRDARWEDGMLNIRFQPDPRVWPRHDPEVDGE
ncbi:ArsA family ATPase [Williamsia maris]|uniref:Arsenite-transporting ATPase n=1 Tax=Williamsia maris TaxID=72806 RepID=A0ABT1HGY8_9NOCA|nr:ArsA-related P-loop ATPase [Williamsia maris]MCP2176990.1 arsenite-transporting ATPase [Williamsia maris]